MMRGRRLPRLLARLPERFQWTLHNVVAHPVCELAFQAGWDRLSEHVHDITIPAEVGPPRHPDQVTE